MASLIIYAIFICGYVVIAFGRQLKLNKALPAMLIGVLCWAVYILQGNADKINSQLATHLSDIAGIIFFLFGAMAIVELILLNEGFSIITRAINITSKRKLLIIVTLITFFLSAVLNNLTTAIVMCSLTDELIENKDDKMWFSGMIIIAANAGGAWSPLGDVTSTMLWVGGQVTAANMMMALFFPALVSCAVPMFIIARQFKHSIIKKPITGVEKRQPKWQRRIILFSGVGLLMSVPVFKNITQLPPYMAILLALSVLGIITAILHRKETREARAKFTLKNALMHSELTSLFFFLGILLAVAALQAMGTLQLLASSISHSLHNVYLTGSVLGAVSAIVSNVPLVAAVQGMFPLSTYATDSTFWEFLVYTTGTGGSLLIIGSAAGIAVMEEQDMSFVWYFKKISWLAALGFAAGTFTYMLEKLLL